MELEMRQKSPNVAADRPNRSHIEAESGRQRSLIVKTNAANTSRFLIHCLGRIVRTSASHMGGRSDWGFVIPPPSAFEDQPIAYLVLPKSRHGGVGLDHGHSLNLRDHPVAGHESQHL